MLICGRQRIALVTNETDGANKRHTKIDPRFKNRNCGHKDRELAAMLLSQVIQDNPSLTDFWALERCVSAEARKIPPGASAPLTCDVEPEFRCTPRKWDIILAAAHNRGLRARQA
jgi:hypothetical protein